MELSTITETILGQGIWCILFVYFYLDNNKKNENREQRYMQQIEESSKREMEYQRIINDYNKEIIPTLKEIKEEIKNV